MNPRTSGRGVYARRRLLAVLVVLLLLALLVPRACQALMGSGNDAGPNGEQQAGAVGTDTGEGNDAGDDGTSDSGEDGTVEDDTGEDDAAKQEGSDEARDEPSSRGVPFKDDAQGNGSGDDEDAPDLLALVTPLAADEEAAAGEDQDAGGSAPSPSGTGGEPQAEEQPISELQFALAASPEQQPSSEGGRAPTRRAGPAEPAPVAEPAATSRGERIRARVDRRAATPVAEPAALHERDASQIVAEPAAAETFAPAPPAAVAAAPNDTAFASAPVGAMNGAPAVPATLPAGPRLAGPGPSGAPGPSGMPGPSAF